MDELNSVSDYTFTKSDNIHFTPAAETETVIEEPNDL
jgi:hypothetical protein